MARLYSAFAQKGRIGEARVIAPVTWDELTRERVAGEDRVLPGRVAYGAGVMRNLPLIYGPNPATLCHSGWGGSGAFGDPETGLSGAYIMNRQGTHLLEDDRRSKLIAALYGCL
jgi:CubicO group peptidase (beta-lactamase class C family)